MNKWASNRIRKGGKFMGGMNALVRRTGVAIGTVFRHFPTKEALIVAVFVERLRRLTAEARELLDADDPGAAFGEFFLRWTELTVHKQAFIEALRGAGIDLSAAATGGAYQQVQAELAEAVTTLLVRARSGRHPCGRSPR